MSVYVVDTDILSLYQLGNPIVCKKVASHSLGMSGFPRKRRLVPSAGQLVYWRAYWIWISIDAFTDLPKRLICHA